MEKLKNPLDWITRSQSSRWFTILFNSAVLKIWLLTGHYYLLRGMAAQRTFKYAELHELETRVSLFFSLTISTETKQFSHTMYE